MRWPTPARLAALSCVTSALILAGCAATRIHGDGMRLASEGNYDAALPMLQEAIRLDPSSSEFRIDLIKETGIYAAVLLQRADEERASGRTAEAAALYARALKVEPANERARRGLTGIELDNRSAKLVAESERLMREGRLDAAREKVNAALVENPRNLAAQQQLALVIEQVEKAREARAAQAAAQSIMSKPVTLQFRDANLRMVFEALSRTTGLNVILDRDVRADLKTTIFVKDAAVEDTVDLILLQNQLEKRSLNANTLFIFPATAAKQKEYQDLQVRTFQVANADLKYLQTVLKTVLKIKEVSVDERSNTLVMRDTADAIGVAAKVIAAHDVAEPEIMLDVEILEISHDRLSNLGLKWPDSLTLAVPVGPDGSTTIGALKALTRNDLLVSPQLSLGINFKLEDTDADILARPQIRARNKEKARILIGDRIPTIINTVTPMSTGAGVVTGTVQYQDVGLKLEFEPQVYSDIEVGIRINLEVSHIVKEIPGPNGSLAYQIGTRNAQSVVRLRDGETQVLGGLIGAGDINVATKVPGLGHLPVIGRLFGNNNGTVRKSEIVMSITPHILRAPATLDASVRSVFSGTESSLRERALQLDPIGSVRSQSTGGTAPVPAAPGTSRSPGTPLSATPSLAPAQAQQPPRPAPAPPMPPSASPAAPPASSPVDAPQSTRQTPASGTNVRNLLPLMNNARSGAGTVQPQASEPSASSPQEADTKAPQ